MQYEILRGDCISQMRAMPDNSFDSIVCDPPYELGFMGKSWDASGIAYSVEMWAETLRVLKPGGHLLAFSGSRTYHRMTCAIEDAGFEIRDQIMWVYGSGFPKSLDVSKAIDKCNGNPRAFRVFADAYAAAIAASNLTHVDVDRALGVKSSSCYWARSDHRGGMPPRHHWEGVCALLPIPKELSTLYDEAEREVIGTKRSGISDGGPKRHTIGGASSVEVDITAPSTDAARQWEGWGTALKPAHEPICVARKPLAKGATVAANVLQFGTGALNIDGCRVATDDNLNGGTYSGKPNAETSEGWRMANGAGQFVQPSGRWPANLILSYNEDEFALRSDTTPEQLRELQEWMNANA